MNRKRCGRKWPWSNLTYCPEVGLEGLRKIIKNVSQDSRSARRDLNPARPEK